MRLTRIGTSLCVAAAACACGQSALDASADKPATAINAEIAGTLLSRTDSLKTVPVPGPDDHQLAKFVRDKNALVVLGKALFWDQQVGSDGQACASCHFHAGADSRSKNQLDSGGRSTMFPGGDMAFAITKTHGGGPNTSCCSTTSRSRASARTACPGPTT
jgi:cytochrome c peroxidase